MGEIKINTHFVQNIQKLLKKKGNLLKKPKQWRITEWHYTKTWGLSSHTADDRIIYNSHENIDLTIKQIYVTLDTMSKKT